VALPEFVATPLDSSSADFEKSKPGRAVARALPDPMRRRANRSVALKRIIIP
jgi:hypothetical protein